MTIISFLKMYLGMLVVFLALDAVWLGLVAKNMYQKGIGHLMTENIVWAAAGVFYLLYLVGIWYFAIRSSESLLQSMANGAALGVLCYATYDLTNWATLREWPAYIVAGDLLWGAFITAVCAGVGYFISQM